MGSMILENVKKYMRDNQFILTDHARVRMFENNISTDNIKTIIDSDEIIENYPNDRPCPSVLILGSLDTLPYHLVVAICNDHVRIITLYKPEKDQWNEEWKKRK